MPRGKIMRKNYLVHRGMQFRYSVTIFIATFVISVLAVWTTYLTTWTEISAQMQSTALSSRIDRVYTASDKPEKNVEMINAIFATEFSDVFDRVSLLLLVRLLIGSMFLFILSIFVSHKIAGPALRMERAAQALQKGDLTVDMSKLRLGDELGDLAGALHGAVSRLRIMIDECKENVAQLAALSKDIARHIAHTPGASPELTSQGKDMQVIANELVTSMSRLRTSRQPNKK